jgi:membrane-anchored mycosin MYCP
MRGGTGRTLTGVTPTGIVAVCAALIGTLGVMPAASASTTGCSTPPAAGPRNTAMPYEQQRFDPDRLAPLATGAGITVAVIDSGVDGDHPQLRGQVDPGHDFLHNRSGREDCRGHGTGVAGIIAAQPVDDEVKFRGLAPDAHILPIRVTENSADGERPASGTKAEIAGFAKAISWAVDHGADVINLSLTLDLDDTDVRRAVERAIRKNVVVVAAVGNKAESSKGNNPTPYPAAYPGVLGVGAISRDGRRMGFSQFGTYVDVVAPGDAVVTAMAGGGHQSQSGTSFATPFVSATAALVRQRFPDLTAEQVIDRIVDTADPAPGGRRSDDYGRGVVNPYRALTESVLPAPSGRAVAPLPGEDPVAAALQARRDRAQDRSLIIAAIGAGITALLVIVVLVVPAGRRRRWLPGR